MFRSLSCEASVAAASDFHLSKYILYTYTKKMFSEIRVPPLYGHFINYCEIEMEVLLPASLMTRWNSLFLHTLTHGQGWVGGVGMMTFLSLAHM